MQCWNKRFCLSYLSSSARLDGQKQSFLFFWDSKWPPCDKGLLKIYYVGFCLFSCPNFAFELNSFHRKSWNDSILFLIWHAEENLVVNNKDNSVYVSELSDSCPLEIYGLKTGVFGKYLFYENQISLGQLSVDSSSTETLLFTCFLLHFGRDIPSSSRNVPFTWCLAQS